MPREDRPENAPTHGWKLEFIHPLQYIMDLQLPDPVVKLSQPDKAIVVSRNTIEIIVAEEGDWRGTLDILESIANSLPESIPLTQGVGTFEIEPIESVRQPRPLPRMRRTVTVVTMPNGELSIEDYHRGEPSR